MYGLWTTLGQQVERQKASPGRAWGRKGRKRSGRGQMSVGRGCGRRDQDGNQGRVAGGGGWNGGRQRDKLEERRRQASIWRREATERTKTMGWVKLKWWLSIGAAGEEKLDQEKEVGRVEVGCGSSKRVPLPHSSEPRKGG